MLVLIGRACAVGIILWNIGLHVANAAALNVDSVALGLSVQDIGSAVLAFGATLGAAAIVGLVTLIVDRFG